MCKGHICDLSHKWVCVHVNIYSGFVSSMLGAIDVSGLRPNFSEVLFHWHCYFTPNDAVGHS